MQNCREVRRRRGRALRDRNVRGYAHLHRTDQHSRLRGDAFAAAGEAQAPLVVA